MPSEYPFTRGNSDINLQQQNMWLPNGLKVTKRRTKIASACGPSGTTRIVQLVELHVAKFLWNDLERYPCVDLNQGVRLGTL